MHDDTERNEAPERPVQHRQGEGAMSGHLGGELTRDGADRPSRGAVEANDRDELLSGVKWAAKEGIGMTLDADEVQTLAAALAPATSTKRGDPFPEGGYPLTFSPDSPRYEPAEAEAPPAPAAPEPSAPVAVTAGDREAIARVRTAIEPVFHWYQSDEHPDRPLEDIIADIVADLQEDRKAALAQPRAAMGDGVAEELGGAQEWADMLSELYDWTGSAWLAGETRDKPPKGIHSFLTSLIGYLMAGRDAALALQSPPAARAHIDRGASEALGEMVWTTEPAAKVEGENPAAAELFDMLRVATQEGGMRVFDHTPEEIGLHVMENADAILALQPAAQGDAAPGDNPTRKHEPGA